VTQRLPRAVPVSLSAAARFASLTRWAMAVLRVAPVAMTEERSLAYGRVMTVVAADGDLRPNEIALLRHAADALLFAAEPGADTAQALSETQAVSLALVDSGRWNVHRAGDLMTAVRACGPEGLPGDTPLVGEPRFARRVPWMRR